MSSLIMVGVAFGSVAAGALADRIGSRRRVFTTTMLLAASVVVAPYVLSGPLLPIGLLVLGAVMGAVPATSFASAPEAAGGPQHAGSAMAGMMLAQNAGFVVGPILFAALPPGLGWQVSAKVTGVLVLIGSVVGSRVRVA